MKQAFRLITVWAALSVAYADYPGSIVDGIPLVDSLVLPADCLNTDVPLLYFPSGVLPCGTTLSHTESGVSAFATVGVLWVVNPVHGLAEGSIFPVLQDKEPFTFERLEEIRRNGLIGLIVEEIVIPAVPDVTGLLLFRQPGHPP